MTESEEIFFFLSASAEGIRALFQLRIYLESFFIVLSWISTFSIPVLSKHALLIVYLPTHLNFMLLTFLGLTLMLPVLLLHFILCKENRSDLQ